MNIVQLSHIRPVSPFPSYHHVPDAPVEVIPRYQRAFLSGCWKSNESFYVPIVVYFYSSFHLLYVAFKYI